MKSRISKIIFTFILILPCIFYYPSAVKAITSEDKAIDELADKVLSQQDKLKGKRICIFKFTSIEGKETPEGAKVS